LFVSSASVFMASGGGPGGNPEDLSGTDSDDILGPSDSDEDDDVRRYTAKELIERLKQVINIKIRNCSVQCNNCNL